MFKKQKEKKEENRKVKKKSNFHKTFPVFISIMMVVIVLIQSISVVFLVCFCKKNGVEVSTIWKACQELFAGNFITLGISIIAIAVSVWMGLNINIAIDKGELSEKITDLDIQTKKLKEQNENNLLEFKQEHDRIANDYKERYESNWLFLKREYVDCLKMQWINMVLSILDEYPLSGYLGNILKDIDIAGNMELIDSLMRYESEYISVTKLYENGLSTECIDKAKELLDYDIYDKNISKELQLYYDVRKSDLWFYKCACEIRGGKKDEILITELEQSLDVYKKLEKERSVIAFSSGMEVYAYICNTIGYSYDLMNQVIPDTERRREAVRYMEKAVSALKEGKSKKRGRYYRNLGLTYQHNVEWEKAREAYEKSMVEDPSDYKSYVTVSGIILNNIEKRAGVTNRTKLLCEMEEDVFLLHKKDLEYVIELCKESMNINYLFEDPYYKIAQAYTYLFLGAGKRKEDILEAERYLNKLQRRGFDRAGYKFALRNMYEAMGDIHKAMEVNNTITHTSTNDVEKIAKLYEKYLETNKKIEGTQNRELTMGETLMQTSKFNLVEDYSMLYSGLEVASELWKKPELSYEDWALLHGIIKDYLVDRANKYAEDYTVYTDKIYDCFEEMFEEINRRKPNN